MKILSNLIIFCSVLFSENTNEILSTINIAGDEFSIKIKVKDVTTGVYGESTAVYYTVRKGEKFIHPDDLNGGKAIGCKFYTGVNVRTVSTSKSDFGWEISLGGICGNTYSGKYIYVIPYKDYGGYKYHIYEIISKEEPTITEKNGLVEILYYYQEWGKGGTATSIFVPQCFTINTKPTKYYTWDIIKKGNVLEALDKYDYVGGFRSLFVAGMNDLNIELMEYAINKMYDPQDKELYTAFGLPPEKIDYLNIAKDFRHFKNTLNKNKFLTNWKLFYLDNNIASSDSLVKYFPLKIGAIWEYIHMGNEQFSYKRTISYKNNSSYVIQNLSYHPKAGYIETEEIIKFNSAKGIEKLATKNAFGGSRKHNPPLLILPIIKTNEKWMTYDGDDVQECRIEYDKSVNTQSGYYTNCIRVIKKQTVDWGAGNVKHYFRHLYYAPNVGLVKELFGEKDDLKPYLELVDFNF